MSISFPITDIFTRFRFRDQKFSLQERQEISRMPSGYSIGKSFGSAVWVAEWTSAEVLLAEMMDLEAALATLDGVIGTFMGGDQRRVYPLAHSAGVFTDSGQINALGGNNKSLSLKSLPAGLQLSIGDYLSFTYGGSTALHQVMEAATANGSGVTPTFEVRPHIRSGAAVNAAVKLKRPEAVFQLVPGSISPALSTTASGIVSFKGVQVL